MHSENILWGILICISQAARVVQAVVCVLLSINLLVLRLVWIGTITRLGSATIWLLFLHNGWIKIILFFPWCLRFNCYSCWSHWPFIHNSVYICNVDPCSWYTFLGFLATRISILAMCVALAPTSVLTTDPRKIANLILTIILWVCLSWPSVVHHAIKKNSCNCSFTAN